MKAIDKVITVFEDVTTIVSFILMTVTTLIGILFRYVFSNPIVWVEEVARYFMVWGIFIGLGIVTRNNAQISINILTDYAPEKIRTLLNYTIQILLIVTYISLLIISILFIKDAIKTNQLTPMTRIPFYYVYLALPIGFALCTYRSVQIFFKSIIRKDEV